METDTDLSDGYFYGIFGATMWSSKEYKAISSGVSFQDRPWQSVPPVMCTYVAALTAVYLSLTAALTRA